MMAMSGFVAFVLLLTGMGVGTLICGLAPLSLPLSHRMMRVLEVFGAGLLVGAAVIVVIPEGSSALFSHVTPESHAHASVYSRVLHPASGFHSVSPQTWAATPLADANAAQEPWAWSFITKRSEPPSEGGKKHGTHKDEPTFTHSDAEHRLGSSILFGIVLMYVIDQLTSGGTSSAKSEDGMPNHHHNHDYAPPPPIRPRLETHRLAKSFHQKPDPSAAPKNPYAVRSKDSFPIFDRSEHGVADNDEEANIGNRSTRASADAHRRVESTATSTSSDNDLPDDYDDDHHNQHAADFNRVGSSHNHHNSAHSSTTLRREDSGAPLLDRHNSVTSTASGRRRSRSQSSSVHASHTTTFGQALTTIVGLLIHATADGIAMGASAQSGDQTLTMVVFFAIMIHKAPAAFGLCAMLMSQRLSRTSVRKAVAVFALASPLGAVLTYVLLAAFFDADIASSTGGGGGGGGIDGKSIGTALAFSGGTFLFVAFHAVLELAGVEADTLPGAGDEGEVQVLGKWLRIALLIAGACTPRGLQSLLSGLGGGGGHGH